MSDPPPAPMRDRICVVTGANAGMGKETALALARLGATVAMVCRIRQRGEAAVAEVKQATGNGRVDLVVGDLASLAGVRALAAELTGRHDRIHVLVNNAGVLLEQRMETRDGYEMTFAVNYLAPFLLTNLLRPTLVASAPARVVNVVSAVHKMGKLDFADLQSTRGYRGFRGAYAQSKFALVVFTYELARRLEADGITVNAADPGGTKTNTQMPGIMKLVRPFFQSAAKGAETAVWLASAPELESTTGAYFSKQREQRAAEGTYDRATAQRLWEVSCELTGYSDDGAAA